MKTIRKIQKTLKTLGTFLNQCAKNYMNMKKKMKAIWLMLFAILCLTACGTTKVSVNRPDNGTYTQIVVTTNNPITTNTDADASAELNTKK